MPTVGSLFSGVGGLDQGFIQAGFDLAWMVEKDEICQSILRRHHPETPLFDDVRAVGAHNLGPVDVIVGGSPCQDLSVAGKRAGLEGARSGLFYEFARIVGELQPSWVVFENVPGLLSSNGGDDFRVVLDELSSLRYVIDADILDAQHFGVPQRRRRVFLACQHADSILQMSTPTSWLTTSQALLEILRSTLTVMFGPSSSTPKGTASAKYLSAAGLQKRMRLFGIASENELLMLLRHWDAATLRYHSGPEVSDFASVSHPSGDRSQADTSSNVSAFQENQTGPLGSISPLSKRIWDALSLALNSSTISTATRQTMASEIFGCVQAVLHISERIARSSIFSSHSSNVASLSSTVLKECIGYAGQVDGEGTGELGWLHNITYLRGRAEALGGELERHIGATSSDEVFSDGSGLHGHPPSGGKARQTSPRTAARGFGIGGRNADVAGTLGTGASATGGHRQDLDTAGAYVTVPSVTSHYGKGTDSDATDPMVIDQIPIGSRGDPTGPAAALTSQQKRYDGESQSFVVAQCHGNNVGPLGTLRRGNGNVGGGVPFMAVDLYSGLLKGDKAGTMTAGQKGRGQNNSTPAIITTVPTSITAPASIQPPLTVSLRGRAGGGTAELGDNVAAALRASQGGGDKPYALVEVAATVLAFHPTQDPINSEGISHAMGTEETGSVAIVVPEIANTMTTPVGGSRTDRIPTVAFIAENQRAELREMDVSPSLSVGGGKPGMGYPAVRTGYAVRRLTPLECEKLQGWEPNWTKWDDKGKEIPDTHRYRCIGNGVATPCALIIAERLMDVGFASAELRKVS